jgi:hypothetical protein
MADAPAAAHAAGKDPLKFLTQKVGPLPVFAWAGAAVVIWWYLQKKQGATAATTGGQTDPAGNVGTIDPGTGYVYGSSEDQAALAAGDGTLSSGTSAGTNATTGAQKYADNNAWGIAAVNYLVGISINGTLATQAIQAYLNGDTLTTAQQGDVNLAIQAIGAPPVLPSPSVTATTGTGAGSADTGNTGTASTWPSDTWTGTGTTGTTGGSTAAAKPPASSPSSTSAAPYTSGGHVVSVGSTTAVIAWTPHGAATTWRQTIVGPGKINGFSNVDGIPQATYSGLEPGHNYEVTIQPLINGKPAGQSGVIHFLTTGGTAATTAKK